MPLPRSSTKSSIVSLVERDLAADDVVDDGRAPSGTRNRSTRPGPGPEAAVARVAVVARLALAPWPGPGSARGSGRSSRRGPSANSRSAAATWASALALWKYGPSNVGSSAPMPIQASASMMPCVHSGRLRASSVSSMRSTNRAAEPPGQRPVEQRRARPADVEEARSATARTGSGGAIGHGRATLSAPTDRRRRRSRRRRSSGRGCGAGAGRPTASSGRSSRPRRISVNIAGARATERSLAASHASTEPPALSMHGRRSARRAPSAGRRARAERAWVCQRSERGSAPMPSHSHVRSRRSNISQSTRGHVADVAAVGRGDLDEVERRCAAAATRRPARRDRSGTPAASRDASPECTTSAIAARRAPARATGAARSMPGRNWATAAGDVDRRAAVAQQPQRAALGHPPAVEEQVELDVERRRSVERVDLVPQRGEVEDLPRRRPTPASTSTTDAPVSSVIRWSNEMPDRLTIWLTTPGGDDLAAQRVARGSRRRSARAARVGK